MTTVDIELERDLLDRDKRVHRHILPSEPVLYEAA